MKRVWFASVAVLLFGIIAFYVNHDRDFRAKIVLGDQSYMEDVRIVQRRDGVAKWTLNAKKAVFETENDIRLSDLGITFPEKKLVLNSEGGLYNTETRNLRIDGNVKATTGTYDVIASSLLWDGKTNELISDQKVQIVGKQFVVEGDDFTATTAGAKLQKNVRAVFNGKK
ncbi:MAG: hypothetical protein FD164_886 [Nitrospirae bacterium]|nr:MAG: hypothetical protein FD164_886 [Nitrospirota bacterium]